MLEAATAFIVRTTDWRSPALPIFRRRLAVVSLMTSSRVPSPSGLGWKRASDLRRDLATIAFAILVAQFFGGIQCARFR
jgi:hypothetical protein